VSCTESAERLVYCDHLCGQLEVRGCFQVHRYRMDREVEVFTGVRVDVLRSAGDSFRIASRTVYLDHATVLANNLNLFF
jgi:3-phenylpropionate/cinnamic acid dioxygenase small subunit